MSDDRDLIDEATLRRALRFEADESIPRFDIASIAAAAREEGPSRRVVALGLVAAIATGVAAGAMWSAIFTAAPDLGDALVSAALQAIVLVAIVLEPVAEAAAQPVVPLSLLAALIFAIAHERRERAHVHAS